MSVEEKTIEAYIREWSDGFKQNSVSSPRVGETIYIPSSAPEDVMGIKINGGLARVTRIVRVNEGSSCDYEVQVGGLEFVSYNWSDLKSKQEALKKEFGENPARTLV